LGDFILFFTIKFNFFMDNLLTRRLTFDERNEILSKYEIQFVKNEDSSFAAGFEEIAYDCEGDIVHDDLSTIERILIYVQEQYEAKGRRKLKWELKELISL
jgi:hypothetical protein